MGEIGNVEVFKGDKHEGKSVSLVIFENGKLIYKPRYSSNIVFFEKLSRYIISKSNTSKDENKLLFGNLLDRKTYSWQEFIEYVPCENSYDVKKFYYRSGIFLGLFYFLNTYDMHHENIICNNGYPFIVDLETISKAIIIDLSSTTLYRDLSSSVLNSSFIPYYSESSVFDINMSGLLSETDMSETQSEYILTESEDGDIAYEEVAAGVYVDKNKPQLGDLDLSKKSIENSILSGFSCCCEIVFENKNEFIKIIQDFFDNNELKCRQLLRPTQVYHEFIQASFHPSITSSNEKYNKLLNILYKNFKISKHGYLRVEKEVDEIKQLNIPLLYTKTDSLHLYSNKDTIVCKNYYGITIRDNIINKIKKFSLKDIDRQKNIISQSILTTFSDDDFGFTKIKEKSNAHKLEIKDVNRMVAEYMDSIKLRECMLSNDFSTIYIPYLVQNKHF